MRTMGFWLGLFLVVLLAATPTPPVQPVAITWPVAEAAIQGQVTIRGRTAVPRFQSARLDFQPLPVESPQATPLPHAWLPITAMDRPVVQGVLGTWDTSSLAPGPYLLRLQVRLNTGQMLEHRVRVWVGTEPPRSLSTPFIRAGEGPTTPTPTMPLRTPRSWPQAVEPWVPATSVSSVALMPQARSRALLLGAALGAGVVLGYVWWQHRRRG